MEASVESSSTPSFWASMRKKSSNFFSQKLEEKLNHKGEIYEF